MIVATRLTPVNAVVLFKLQSVALHAGGTVEALKNGALSPPRPRSEHDDAGLQALVAETAARLRAETREAIDAREGHDLTLTTPASTRVFITTDFVPCFALPNFHVHAATPFAILRQAGALVGKRDFLGQLRIKEMC